VVGIRVLSEYRLTAKLIEVLGWQKGIAINLSVDNRLKNLCCTWHARHNQTHPTNNKCLPGMAAGLG
jgi:hypothetical protein